MLISKGTFIERKSTDADAEAAHGEHDAFAALKQFTQAAQTPSSARCELCSVALCAVHPHLLEREARKITCSCEACAILFGGRQDGKFLRIPQCVRALDGFTLSDLDWAELSLPIQLAFFYRDLESRLVAAYPSPAGAVESTVSLESLHEIFARRWELRGMEALVEALLVNRIGETHSYLLAPIDECYRLVGLIRTKWRGLSGGAEVWSAISGLFRELQMRANQNSQEIHARSLIPD